MDIQNFAFVKTIDAEALTKAIIFVNRSRHHPFNYKRITQSAPRSGWIAIVIHHPASDHYLLRNISGRLSVRTVELGTNGFSIAYRVHQNGKTTGAFESHLALWITQQLRALMATGNMAQIDLAEPAGRLILRRYHEYRRSWSSSKANESVTPDLKRYYDPNPSDLAEFLKTGTDISYVRDVIKPGFSATEAFTRLLEVLELPYIDGAPVIAELANSKPEVKVQSSINASPSAETDQTRTLRGAEILAPATWNGQLLLPRGWVEITEEQWKADKATASYSKAIRRS